ncbi:macrophage mannose receptor 1-like [Dicentrarchus labrax]|nr:macrophage mannose receptor 1-like [Dicentrarchus labrax]
MPPACTPIHPGIRRTMLCILLLSGMCSCLHNYYLIDEPKTWLEARQYCKENYTDLATIDNMEDMERLISAAGSGYEGKVWIGLTDKPFSWGWSLSESGFYGQGEKNFRKWNNGEPDNMKKQKWLCTVLKNSVWNDCFCEDVFTFVCYDKNGSGSESTSSGKYIYINKVYNWWDARQYCRNHHTDLASVRNETENMRIQEVVPRDKYVFIGLHRIVWYWWSDKTKPNFENWADGHPVSPTDTCATSVINAIHHGKWVENHCDEKLHFICHNIPDKTQVLKVKLTALKTTIDLNNPAVTEAILNQVEESLKEKGIKKDLKISWIKNKDNKIFQEEENTPG